MSFIKDIKLRYKTGNIVEKFIFINIGVFIVSLLFKVIFGLYKTNGNFIFNWFALEHNFSTLITKPWSIISYGFLHAGFIHILFNMIALYYIGNLFIQYFTQKQLIHFYVLGTFFGGLLFMLSNSYFPLFEGTRPHLVGASAGISAIFIGLTTYIPNYQLQIRFIGFVKLWHLAAIWIGLDVIGLVGNNAGGHFSHLGGALFGFLYVNQAANTKLNIWDKLSGIFTSRKKPLHTVYKSSKKTVPKSKNTDLTQQQIDGILDKISKSGYDSLTKSEKEFLFKQGKK
ncbi:rhomboid family intramembrane serine protease [uncultured Polaribacter sp.]|uniref:rhomboid family intramembrane serine protease n=1 Tax=uncultured Polaribacter sp. TaxID=174711 RepID=UPI002622D657|nr:rhomboid family intramembrane serine protease [uncultured Polaribacter sp.]